MHTSFIEIQVKICTCISAWLLSYMYIVMLSFTTIGLRSKHSPGMPESSDAKLKPAELKQESDSPDFASKIRSEIVNEYREGKDLSSCCDVSAVLRYLQAVNSSGVSRKDFGGFLK